MSTTSLIRGALKKATGALTETEIAEAIGEDPKSVRTLVYAMVKSGEVDREANDDGKSAYLLNAEYTPSRKRPGDDAAAAEETPVPTRQKRAAKTAKRSTRKAKKATRAKPSKKVARKPARKQRAARALDVTPAAVAGAADPPVVQVRRGTLRALLSFVFASERPLDAGTRAAVIDATTEAA